MLRKKNLQFLRSDYVEVNGKWRETTLLQMKIEKTDVDRINWIEQHAVSYRIREVPSYDVHGRIEYILWATFRIFPEQLTFWKLRF